LPVTHASSVLHAFPHAPQLWLSVCVSTHEIPPSRLTQTVAAGAHNPMQLPFEQMLAVSHVFPHAPQFFGSLFVLVHTPSHDCCGLVHDEVAPLEHAAIASATPQAARRTAPSVRSVTCIEPPTAPSS
jgi:hypothetical protein